MDFAIATTATMTTATTTTATIVPTTTTPAGFSQLVQYLTTSSLTIRENKTLHNSL
jgi:hypothetical protein